LIDTLLIDTLLIDTLSIKDMANDQRFIEGTALNRFIKMMQNMEEKYV